MCLCEYLSVFAPIDSVSFFSLSLYLLTFLPHILPLSPSSYPSFNLSLRVFDHQIIYSHNQNQHCPAQSNNQTKRCKPQHKIFMEILKCNYDNKLLFSYSDVSIETKTILYILSIVSKHWKTMPVIGFFRKKLYSEGF